MINLEKKIKILVVDDSDLILNLFREIFGDNFEVITCVDGLEGIQKAAEYKPDIIFLDLMMPNLDGIKMLQVKKVLKDIQDIPVIVMSANTQRQNVLAAMEAGAEKIISKPLKKEEIITCVEEVLDIKNKVDFKKGIVITEEQNTGIKSQLAKFFVSTFPSKKKLIQQAMKNRNIEVFKSLIHEIKGAGGTMGYPEITEISKEIEARDMLSAADWVFVEFKCNQIFNIIQQIENRIKQG